MRETFAIIYNSAIISIGERQRDLATLKVMGFTHGEITRVIFYEYVLLALIGVMSGLPLGKLLCALTVQAYDTDIYRFPLIVYPTTYMKTALGIAAFVAISQWACRRRIQQLNMVEAIKVHE